MLAHAEAAIDDLDAINGVRRSSYRAVASGDASLDEARNRREAAEREADKGCPRDAGPRWVVWSLDDAFVGGA